MMEKTNKAMKASRIMVWFHFSFTVLGLAALFLMTMKIIMLDWLALWITVLAIALNAFFTVMWHNETKEPQAITQPVVTGQAQVFPMLSLVVSTYNQEATISHALRSLFKCASDYRGPSEIVLVDDGSTDSTYEAAWATLDSLHKESPSIRTRAIKHMAHLGKTEVAKTGSNKAMGEYLILADAAVTYDFVSLNNLIDSFSATKKDMISYEVTRSPRQGKTEAPSSILLVHADTLRRLLDKEPTESYELNI